MSVVVTSAFVAAIVSGLFTLLSQCLERRERKKELLFKTAAELAVKHADFALGIRMPGQRVEIPPYGWLTYEFHRQLKHLMEHGKLPPDSQEKLKSWLKEDDSTKQ